MTATVWRVSRRLALSGHPDHRWRQFSLVVGGFIATLAALLGAGVMHAGSVSSQHITDRAPAVAVSGADTVKLHISARAVDVPEMGQIPVTWLDPLPGHQDDPTIVPPGLERLPGPGQAVLSPGLIARGVTAGDFGLDPAQPPVISDEGLASRSEGLVYARPGPDRSLGEAGAIIPVKGYYPAAAAAPMETINDVPGLQGAIVGSAWTLWLPAAYLLLGCARAQSPVRTHRAAVLWTLGVSRWHIRQLLALETAALATVGAVPALLVWQLWLAHSTRFPLNDAELLPGAASTPWWWALLTALLTVGTAAAAAASARVLPVSHARSSRRIRGHHLIPLGVALGAMAVSPLLLGGRGLALLFAGLLLTLLTLPLAIPVLASRSAQLLGSSRSPELWLAGRKLALRTRNLSRPAVVAAALVFVTGSAYALLVGLQDDVIEPMGGDRNVWSVSWRDVRPGDVDRVRSRAGSDIVIAPIEPLEQELVPGVPPESVGTIYFSSCADLRSTAGVDTACDSDTTHWGYHVIVSDSQDLVPDDTQEVLVSAPLSTSSLEVMQVFSGLPAPNVSQLQGESDFMHPGVDWLRSGWAAATLLLIVAVTRELGDRAHSAIAEGAELIRAGLHPEEAQRTFAAAVLTPVLVALPLGYLGAVIFALRGYGLGVTAFNLGLISVIALGTGALATGVIAGVLRWQSKAG